MTAGSIHNEADLTTVANTRYEGEANNVAHLLEKGSTDVSKRLSLDSQLSPHEAHNFLGRVQEAYDSDRAKNAALPELSISEDKDGFKVGLKKAGDKDPTNVFEKKYDQAAKAGDNPIPKVGDLLGLTPEQTKKILDVQSQEKAAGKQAHLFGDIAVSLGLKTPEQVNAALEKQDHLRAQRLADDMSHSMPLGHKEGYFQLLKRTHPELDDHNASLLAHTMKRLNHNKSELKVGSQLPVLSLHAKDELEEKIYTTLHKKTGTVHAKLNQPLSEVTVS
jgi:hypothetical protein